MSGKYRTIKNYANLALLLVYFITPWLRWQRGANEPNQMILVDLPMRRSYFGSLNIGPDELYYVTALLILAALGLFFITSILGRIWCGYTCPHTVFVDLFIKIETLFQGDRNARMKLDSQALDLDKLIKKFATHISWLILSWLFAFGWVCYFYNAPDFVHDLIHNKLNQAPLAWMIGLTASTYLFAGFMREKVCTYMCPYGRFQSVMIDSDTKVVHYNEWRGEPRKDQGSFLNQGDCIDCNRCVIVCPMGIDIRNGLQMACISCGLCIDACDDVMDKINKPLGLISYDSLRDAEAKKNSIPATHHPVSPKALIYGLLFLGVGSAIFYCLYHEMSFSVSIEKDRNDLFTITPDGSVRNSYIISIKNKELQPKTFCITATGSQDYRIKIQSYHGLKYNKDYKIENCVTMPEGSEIAYKMFVKNDNHQSEISRENIVFKTCESINNNQCIETISLFIMEEK